MDRFAVAFLLLALGFHVVEVQARKPSFACANVKCGPPKPFCVELPSGPTCVQTSCITTKCSATTQCVDTADGPRCQPKVSPNVPDCEDDVPPKDEECPGGIPNVRCQDPCNFKKCRKGTKCVPNKCRPCSAVCESTCPNGVPNVACVVEPCSKKKCARGTTCVVNECAPCSATCKKNEIEPPQYPGSCPDGSLPVNCFADPCKFKSCPRGATCHSNYCGGCNAECKYSS